MRKVLQALETYVVAGALTTAGATYFITSSNVQVFNTERSKLEETAEVSSRKSTARKELIFKAITWLKDSDLSAVEITSGGDIRIYDGDHKFQPTENLLVLKGTSPMLNNFYDQMPKDISEMAKKTLDFVIFANLKDENFDAWYIGNGTALLKNGLSQKRVPSTLGHEAQHASSGINQRLAGELKALKTGLRVLHYQLAQNKAQIEDKELIEKIRFYDDQIMTAEYLSQQRFKGLFNDIYPTNLITSIDLLKAKINPDNLKEISKITLGKKGLDEELYFASEIAYIADYYPRLEGIKRLYEGVTNPASRDMEIANAILALGYLVPDVLTLKFVPNSNYRGISIHIGGNPIDKISNLQYQGELKYSSFLPRRSRFIAFGELPSLEKLIAYSVEKQKLK